MKRSLIRKEPLKLGLKVAASVHPAIHGTIVDIREVNVLDKLYRIYKVYSETRGSEWINEIYLDSK